MRFGRNHQRNNALTADISPQNQDERVLRLQKEQCQMKQETLTKEEGQMDHAIPRKGWVAALLAGLGDTKEKVAENLSLGESFRGFRGDGAICPIKKYLSLFYPNAGLRVGNTAIHGCEDGLLLLDRLDLFGVFSFVQAFDDGEFHHLNIDTELKFKALGRKKSGEIEVIFASNNQDTALRAKRMAQGFVSTWVE
jgi:hypothetical protein